MKIVIAVLACAFSSAVLAAPPPAPQITAAATDIRQLEFNWATVPGAQRYELWFRSAPGAPWVKYVEREATSSTVFRIGVAVHLFNWAQARFHVKACNGDGCSASNQVGVDGEQLAAIGFIKPPAPTGHHLFGSHIALSADGKTLAVITGETLGTAQNSLAVHVYRKSTASGTWRRESRLLPTFVKPHTAQAFGGDNVALSADGNLLVLGAFNEPANGSGLPENAGAVYLFRRTGTTWRLGQRITGEGQDADFFGVAVKIDDAGRTLAVSHQYPGGRWEPGTLEIYRNPVDASDQFVHDRTLPGPPPVDAGDDPMCDAFALSGDGNTLLRACIWNYGSEGATFVHSGAGFVESARISVGTRFGLDVSFDGRTALVQTHGGAEVFRLATGGWQYDGYLTQLEGEDNSGVRHVAISRDGKIAALGNYREFSIGLGPVYPPFQADGPLQPSGGVVIHQRRDSGWEVRRLAKPGSYNVGWAGWSVALGDNGKVLAVGAMLDPSAAAGIDGDRDDDSAPERGAVWLY